MCREELVVTLLAEPGVWRCIIKDPRYRLGMSGVEVAKVTEDFGDALSAWHDMIGEKPLCNLNHEVAEVS